jgi:integrase/recombinase XerD
VDITEAAQWIERNIKLRRRHTTGCQTRLKLKKEWEQSDKCRTCVYWSVGIHGPGQRFSRRSTGQTSQKGAEAALVSNLGKQDEPASPVTEVRMPIHKAIQEYMAYTRDGGAEQSTLEKYKTLMDQLQAYCNWKRLEFIQDFDQDAVLDFRREWENERAGYKMGELPNGKPRWRKMSVPTCKRSAKTLKYFFAFAILRKWVGENPTVVLRFPKASVTKTKEDVKYLNSDQMTDILWAVDKAERMTNENKHRLRTLILLMRWTGLRLSDAVRVTAGMIAGDVLFIETKKASTKVQIPLPSHLVAALSRMTVYDGGYYFWNRRSEGSDPKTPVSNYTTALISVFDRAGIERNNKLSHRFRNTFAVDLLTKGVPLETVSIMLGHQSVQTTERYYADFTSDYMQRAESLVRQAWALNDGERLGWTVAAMTKK